MSKSVVVFHSGYGHTRRMAQAVAEGAQAELIEIDSNGDVSEASWALLGQADAIVFGSPTYMGSVSWQFKKFADATSKAWFTQAWKDKLFAGFTNSASMNGDKLSTLHYMFTLAMQHGGLWVGTGMLPSNAKASRRDDLNYMGSFAGAVATTPSDAAVDEMVKGDLDTAKAFGENIARTLNRMRVV